MSTAIKVENLSKAYQLGEIGTGTISRDLERWFARIRGKEDPFLKIGETNDRASKGTSDVVWSLKDLNFEIQQGDAVGIIGRNGAGKSTLLKLLSRVTAPTTGSMKIKGRVASLLEVGTGFHPELTGRENIYLNGAILGMRKKEITRKFDEIVDFSGVERYVDTPVKRYSSGMYVRLAFAVAAHLESEILIVDEVLAVGDAEFQKKCLGKMGEVSKGEGRTVLFVSHNMAAVQQLCNTGILLKDGLILDSGKVGSVLATYFSGAAFEIAQKPINERFDREGEGNIRIKAINFHHNSSIITDLHSGQKITICIETETRPNFESDLISAAISFTSMEGVTMFVLCNDYTSDNFGIIKGSNKIYCEIDKLPLIEGLYTINVMLNRGLIVEDWIREVRIVNVNNGDYYGNNQLVDTSQRGLLLSHKWYAE